MKTVKKGSKNLLDYPVNGIRTYTGLVFDLSDIKTEAICIEDIAHALSQICRFAGHTSKFFSVAEHCIRVADLLPMEQKLEGLLHDASEAYIGDMPSPFKRIMPEYRIYEANIMAKVAEKFELNLPFTKDLKKADFNSLFYEWDGLMIADDVQPLSPKEAEYYFITYYNSLINEKGRFNTK